MTSNQHQGKNISEDYSAELTSLVQGLFGNYVRSLSIETREEGLILRGNCDSFHTKQMIQEIVAKNTSLRIYSNDLVVIET